MSTSAWLVIFAWVGGAVVLALLIGKMISYSNRRDGCLRRGCGHMLLVHHDYGCGACNCSGWVG